MSFFEIKFIPNDNSTHGKYRFFDTVFSESKNVNGIKKEYQEILKTTNVKVIKRSSL